MKVKFWTEYDVEAHAIIERIKRAIRVANFKKGRKKVAKRNATKRK